LTEEESREKAELEKKNKNYTINQFINNIKRSDNCLSRKNDRGYGDQKRKSLDMASE